MPQSVHSGGSGSSNHHRYVHVVLLSRETVVVPVENKHTRVQDIFSKTCDLVELHETEFFGLAQLKENEFQFLQRDLKISKLTSKVWKSKESSMEEPLQTFYLRVQYYVENISLLKERTTRLHYYLQLKDNLLHFGQLVAEEKCFLLAAYALQADFGDYVADRHGNSYFDPRLYFPSSIVMLRGQDFITTHLPVMHSSMAGMPSAEARVNYIAELSTAPIAHNFHFHKMRKRKYDTAAVAWVAICPSGLGIYEEADDYRYPVTVFHWPDIGKLQFEKKKFEIISEGATGPKYTFYFDCKEWAEYIVDLCRQTHRFHLKLQPLLAELQHYHAHEPRFHEKYVYSENSECTLDRSQSLTRVGPDGCALGNINDPHLASDCTESCASVLRNNPSLDSEYQEQQEIFITTPPRLTSGNSFVLGLPHPLQPFAEYDPKKQEMMMVGGGGVPQKGHLVCERIPAELASYSMPSSSSESLTPLMKSDSFRHDHPPHLMGMAAGGGVAHSQAPSTLTTPSQRSASPNSSAGSGQLPLSLPTSRDVYDAALLRQSLPHGVHFNDYLQNFWSGQEVTSNSPGGTPRKSSLDHLQPGQGRFTEPVQRSTSLRQPLFDWGDGRKGSKLPSQGESGLSVVRSNSDKTPKSSKLALLPEFPGPKFMAPREASEFHAGAAFSLPSRPVNVARSDSNKSQNLSLLPLSSDHVMSLPLTSVSRSDSSKSQPSYQAAVMRSDSGKSQKSGLSLPSDAYQHEEGYSIMQMKDDVQFAPGLPYPIIPVEAQIQKVFFGPTMTAVSTPVRPAAEKTVGNLSALSSYQSPYAYIPDSFPVSVIGPSLRPGAVIYQDAAANTIPSDVLYQSNGVAYPGQLEGKSFPQLSADGDYRERPSPPPYGAFHSTISSVPLQSPIMAQVPAATHLHQMAPVQQHSHATVAKQFPADTSPNHQLQQKSTTGLEQTFSATGTREPSLWLMMNGSKISRRQIEAGRTQLQIHHGSTVDIDQNSQGGTYRDHSNVGKHQVNRDKKNEVTRHVSDRHPGIHDPHCPRHGISSDIRERLRSLGPSVPPMLNALLMDKSLHSTSCTCLDSHGDRRIAAAHSSDSLNLSGLSVQPKGHHHHKPRCLPDSNQEGDATMIVSGTTTSNGTCDSGEIDDVSGQRGFLSSSAQKLQPENARPPALAHRSSDLAQQPQRVGKLAHNQSKSDSATQNFVSSEC